MASSTFERGIHVGGGDGAAIDVGDAPLPSASPAPPETQLDATARLLCVARASLEGALTTRRVVMQRHEAAYSIPLQGAEAVDARDALTVTIYGGVFAWLVAQINLACSATDEYTNNNVSDEEEEEDEDGEGAGAGGAPRRVAARAAGNRRRSRLTRRSSRSPSSRTRSSVSSTSLASRTCSNSFEQLCINYTNEKLQAHFTSTIFAEAVAMYATEGIEIGEVDFRDNDAQVALVDGRPIAALPPRVRVLRAKGTDGGFLDKLSDAFGGGKNPHFARPKVRTKDGEGTFTIGHYAGDVVYAVDGWLAKARGVVRGDVFALLRVTSRCAIPSNLPGRARRRGAGAGGAGARAAGRRRPNEGGADGGAAAAEARRRQRATHAAEAAAPERRRDARARSARPSRAALGGAADVARVLDGDEADDCGDALRRRARAARQAPLMRLRALRALPQAEHEPGGARLRRLVGAPPTAVHGHARVRPHPARGLPGVAAVRRRGDGAAGPSPRGL